MFVVCTDRDALIDTEFFGKLMRFKNSTPFIKIVLLKLQNIFHKINYPEEYSTSNDISHQALGPLFSKIKLLFKQKK